MKMAALRRISQKSASEPTPPVTNNSRPQRPFQLLNDRLFLTNINSLNGVRRVRLNEILYTMYSILILYL